MAARSVHTVTSAWGLSECVILFVYPPLEDYPEEKTLMEALQVIWKRRWSGIKTNVTIRIILSTVTITDNGFYCD